MSDTKLRHKNCGGKVRKTPEIFLSEKLKRKGLTYYCFGQCNMPIKPIEVDKKPQDTALYASLRR